MKRTVLLLSTTIAISGCGGGGTSPNPPAPPPPPPAAVSSVAVVLSAGSALVGQTVQAIATVKDAAGNTLAGKPVTWASSATDIATVSSAGLVTAVGMGSTQITATADGVNGSQPLVVLPSAEQVDSVVLSLDSVEVTVGDTARLTATARDASGNPLPGIQVAWSSSDTTVARVTADGLVSVVDWGEAAIDATVTGPVPSGPSGAPAAAAKGRGSRSRSRIFGVPKISISPATKTANAGDQIFYSAVVSDAAGNPLTRQPGIGWASSKLAVATIDQAGMATAIGKGTTNIVATARVGPNYKYSTPDPKSAKLSVKVCDGIMDVVSWTVNLSTAYTAHTTLQDHGDDYKYDIDQSSTAAATLTRLPDSANVVTWEGVPTGSSTIVDKIVQTGGSPRQTLGTATDGASGPINAGLAAVKLRISVTDNVCTYGIRYQDYVTLTHTEVPPQGGGNFTVPFPAAIAAKKGLATGTKAPGGWILADSTDVPALLFPAGQNVDDDDLSSLLINKYYVPETPVPASMLTLTPNASFGRAKFNVRLVAH